MPAPITDINQLDLNGTYTVADYLSWQFEELVELISGKVLRMSPSPGLTHGVLTRRMWRQLIGQLPENASCQPLAAPMDVILEQPDGRKPTVLIPDFIIVCEPAKLKERACYGAPSWVCEIVSRGSIKRDRVIKKQLYEEAAVPEYTLIYPGEQSVEVYKLDSTGRYGEPEIYDQPGQSWELSSVPGVTLRYDEFFIES